MRVVIDHQYGWTSWGVATLLEQLGVAYQFGAEPGNSDIFFTKSEDFIVNPNTVIVIISPKCFSTKILKDGMFMYRKVRVLYPQEVCVPTTVCDLEIIASFETGEPAIASKENQIFLFPDYFAYIAKATTLQQFQPVFSESFSWDGFRQILLALLELIADKLRKPLVRLWYYPSKDYSNSITFTTDVDHKVQWEIVKNLKKYARIRKFFHQILPHQILLFLGLLASYRHYYSGWFHPDYVGKLRVLLVKTFRVFHLKLPHIFYIPALLHLSTAKLPITAFVRPSDYQVEEGKEALPHKTMRENYTPSRLRHLDVGLHFGCTTGKFLVGRKYEWVNNPYHEDVYRDGILSQVRCFQKEVSVQSVGTRLHHIYGFNQDLFAYLEKAGVLYDSSMFGTIGDTSTFYTPNGCTMPYYPLWVDENGEIRKASFVELPVAVYEHSQIPFEILGANHAAIVLSEHPDRIRSRVIGPLLKGYKQCGRKWWKVDLTQLAQWWHARNAIHVDVVDDTVVVESAKQDLRACVVVYPTHGDIKFSSNVSEVTRSYEENRLYIDLTINSTESPEAL